jgi:flagellar protein FliL
VQHFAATATVAAQGETMSAAAAAPIADDGAAAPVKKGKKKLIVIIAAVLVLLLVAGGGAAIYLKKKAAHDAEATEETATAPEAHGAKPDLKHPPTFLPLDPFVVNLADKEADRYAQVGITLEVEDAKFAEQMKAFMPAIRNSILMILAHKSSRELLERSGKEQLAGEILTETARTMGIEVEEPHAEMKKVAEGEKAEAEDEAKPKAKAKLKPTKSVEPNPIKRVHFANFIIQ